MAEFSLFRYHSYSLLIRICRLTSLLKSILITLLFSSNSLYAYPQNGPETTTRYTIKPLVKGKHSMIVTNNRWSTMAAQRILAQGGNAIDAAIAAAFVLGLTEPQSSGIGGGGYSLVYTKHQNKTLAYDGRETAPHSANPDYFLDQNGNLPPLQDIILSTKSIGVPGEVALLYQMHKKHGSLPWKTLLEPAIQLASQGFPMSEHLHTLLKSDASILIKNPDIKSIYFDNDHIMETGKIIKNPAYAASLTIIATHPESFYQGDLAKEMIAYINLTAGTTPFNLNDFSTYQVKIYPALCSSYRKEYNICSVPPSSGGGVTLEELMGIYAFNSHHQDSNNPKWMYQFLEASKLAYADRNQYLADPAFVSQPVKGLLTNGYLKQRSALVTAHALTTPVKPGIPNHAWPHYAPDNSVKPPGTTSIAIVDKEGNAVSMTLTIESEFGSHLFTHGFFLNNELTDFSLTAKDAQGKLIANRIEAGKRPRSSIAPAMVFLNSGSLFALSGSPGGSDIICYVAKNLILMLDMHLMPDKASAAINLCASNIEPVIESDRPFPQLLLLQKRGEKINRKSMASGVTNILRNAKGEWLGAADPRREGLAIGD